ncbi:MAG TPA: hypothetical protein VMW29_03565 [Candidatus Bathyarchaeia archaeon]|nr:hypothetical protein [Candidatus Bathyarchaeia archaeon]
MAVPTANPEVVEKETTLPDVDPSNLQAPGSIISFSNPNSRLWGEGAEANNWTGSALVELGELPNQQTVPSL